MAKNDTAVEATSRDELLENVAALLTGQAQKTVVAEVVREGDRIILPESMSVKDAIKTLNQRLEHDETEVSLRIPIEGFFLDAMHAFHVAMTDLFGWVQGKPTPGFFGSRPPTMVDIPTGPSESIQVPWGRFAVPGVEGHFQTYADTDSEGTLQFVIGGEIKRKSMHIADKIARKTREVLAAQSVFRGKAFRLRWLDEVGHRLEFPQPVFIAPDDTLIGDLVFSRDVEAAITINVLTPVMHTKALREWGVPLKRGVLLSGPYGTGKSMTSGVVAAECVKNGWTFIMCERADELRHSLMLARRYQPAVVFCEDIDRVMTGERSVSMDDILNLLDGVDAKRAEIMTVLTTNHAERINEAMLRPGRLDAIIDVRPPDAEAVQRLMKVYGRGILAADVDLSAPAAVMAGEIPAVIKEVVDRAKLAGIARGQDEVCVTTADLVASAQAMRNQRDLFKGNKADTRHPTEKAAQITADATVEAARITAGLGNHVDHDRSETVAIAARS